MKNYKLGDILSITTDHLLSERGLDGFKDIIETMSYDSTVSYNLRSKDIMKTLNYEPMSPSESIMFNLENIKTSCSIYLNIQFPHLTKEALSKDLDNLKKLQENSPPEKYQEVTDSWLKSLSERVGNSFDVYSFNEYNFKFNELLLNSAIKPIQLLYSEDMSDLFKHSQSNSDISLKMGIYIDPMSNEDERISAQIKDSFKFVPNKDKYEMPKNLVLENEVKKTFPATFDEVSESSKLRFKKTVTSSMFFYDLYPSIESIALNINEIRKKSNSPSAENKINGPKV